MQKSFYRIIFINQSILRHNNNKKVIAALVFNKQFAVMLFEHPLATTSIGLHANIQFITLLALNEVYEVHNFKTIIIKHWLLCNILY